MRISLLPASLLVCSAVSAAAACAQSTALASLPESPRQQQPSPASQSLTPQSGSAAQHGPPSQPLKVHTPQTPEEAAEALRISKLALIDGVPYDQPSQGDIVRDYVRDSYGLPALLRTSIRTAYAQARAKPAAWQGAEGFGERFGSNAAITVISGNVRFAMEEIFHEDLRYLPCHRCSAWHKIENSLLAEVTARHDEDGHRFFTLTPTVADFAGPIIAHTLWYPGAAAGPLAGVVSARTSFATRIGSHLFREFLLDHHAEQAGREDQ